MSDKIPAGDYNSKTVTSYKVPAEKQMQVTQCLIFKLREDGNSYSVTGIEDKKVKYVVIPEVYHGLPVVEIGKFAFYACEELQGIDIPESVTDIYDFAFYKCKNLKNIYIHSFISKIGINPFAHCSGLEKITVSPANLCYRSNGNCLIGMYTKKLITGCKESVIPADGSVQAIGAEAFNGCSELRSIKIPDGIKTIERCTFCDCTGLLSVNIPASVTKICDHAFYNCSKLQSVAISDSTEVIEKSAFKGCASLSELIIPKNVKMLGENAFEDCSGLQTLEIYGNDLKIGGWSFCDCSNLHSLEFKPGVSGIGRGAFFGCENLKKIFIPSYITDIGTDNPFAKCTKLETIIVDKENKFYHSYGACLIETNSGKLVAGCKNSILPIDGRLTEIGSDAFRGCEELQFLEIPAGIRKIGWGAFKGCVKLQSLKIPSGITTIDSCIADCTDLRLLEIPATVTKFYFHSFVGRLNLKEIAYAGTKEQWGKIDKGWSTFPSCTVHCKDGDIKI